MRGGANPGERRGGRKPGVPNKATAEVRWLAREHGPEAIAELARLAKEARSEPARIAACNALLDRAYGRAQGSQVVELELPDTSTIGGITQSLTAILNAIAAGKLTPAEAQALSNILETQRKALETAELESRIESLERVTQKRNQ